MNAIDAYYFPEAGKRPSRQSSGSYFPAGMKYSGQLSEKDSKHMSCTSALRHWQDLRNCSLGAGQKIPHQRKPLTCVRPERESAEESVELSYTMRGRQACKDGKVGENRGTESVIQSWQQGNYQADVLEKLTDARRLKLFTLDREDCVPDNVCTRYTGQSDSTSEACLTRICMSCGLKSPPNIIQASMDETVSSDAADFSKRESLCSCNCDHRYRSNTIQIFPTQTTLQSRLFLTSSEPNTSLLTGSEPNTSLLTDGEPNTSLLTGSASDTSLLTSGEPVTSLLTSGEPDTSLLTYDEPDISLLTSGEPDTSLHFSCRSRQVKCTSSTAHEHDETEPSGHCLQSRHWRLDKGCTRDKHSTCFRVSDKCVKRDEMTSSRGASDRKSLTLSSDACNHLYMSHELPRPCLARLNDFTSMPPVQHTSIEHAPRPATENLQSSNSQQTFDMITLGIQCCYVRHSAKTSDLNDLSNELLQNKVVKANNKVTPSVAPHYSSTTGNSDQFGNSGNALVYDSPPEKETENWTRHSDHARNEGDQARQQRITFRQCSAARDTRRNIRTFTLPGITHGEFHKNINLSDRQNLGHAQKNINQLGMRNRLLHETANPSQPMISLSACSSELKSLIASTIVEMQKYAVHSRTGAKTFQLGQNNQFVAPEHVQPTSQVARGRIRHGSDVPGEAGGSCLIRQMSSDRSMVQDKYQERFTPHCIQGLSHLSNSNNEVRQNEEKTLQPQSDVPVATSETTTLSQNVKSCSKERLEAPTTEGSADQDRSPYKDMCILSSLASCEQPTTREEESMSTIRKALGGDVMSKPLFTRGVKVQDRPGHGESIEYWNHKYRGGSHRSGQSLHDALFEDRMKDLPSQSHYSRAGSALLDVINVQEKASNPLLGKVTPRKEFQPGDTRIWEESTHCELLDTNMTQESKQGDVKVRQETVNQLYTTSVKQMYNKSHGDNFSYTKKTCKTTSKCDANQIVQYLHRKYGKKVAVDDTRVDKIINILSSREKNTNVGNKRVITQQKNRAGLTNCRDDMAKYSSIFDVICATKQSLPQRWTDNTAGSTNHIGREKLQGSDNHRGSDNNPASNNPTICCGSALSDRSALTEDSRQKLAGQALCSHCLVDEHRPRALAPSDVRNQCFCKPPFIDNVVETRAEGENPHETELDKFSVMSKNDNSKIVSHTRTSNKGPKHQDSKAAYRSKKARSLMTKACPNLTQPNSANREPENKANYINYESQFGFQTSECNFAAECRRLGNISASDTSAFSRKPLTKSLFSPSLGPTSSSTCSLQKLSVSALQEINVSRENKTGSGFKIPHKRSAAYQGDKKTLLEEIKKRPWDERKMALLQQFLSISKPPDLFENTTHESGSRGPRTLKQDKFEKESRQAHTPSRHNNDTINSLKEKFQPHAWTNKEYATSHCTHCRDHFSSGMRLSDIGCLPVTSRGKYLEDSISRSSSETKTAFNSQVIVLPRNRCDVDNSLLINRANNSLVVSGADNSLVTDTANKALVVGGADNSLLINRANNSLVVGGADNSLVTDTENKALVVGGADNSLVTDTANTTLVVGGADNSLLNPCMSVSSYYVAEVIDSTSDATSSSDGLTYDHSRADKMFFRQSSLSESKICPHLEPKGQIFHTLAMSKFLGNISLQSNQKKATQPKCSGDDMAKKTNNRCFPTESVRCPSEHVNPQVREPHDVDHQVWQVKSDQLPPTSNLILRNKSCSSVTSSVLLETVPAHSPPSHEQAFVGNRSGKSGGHCTTNRVRERQLLPIFRDTRLTDSDVIRPLATDNKRKHPFKCWNNEQPCHRMLSPPSIQFDGEQVSYMEIIPKEGIFNGLRLAEVDNLQFTRKIKVPPFAQASKDITGEHFNRATDQHASDSTTSTSDLRAVTFQNSSRSPSCSEYTNDPTTSSPSNSSKALTARQAYLFSRLLGTKELQVKDGTLVSDPATRDLPRRSFDEPDQITGTADNDSPTSNKSTASYFKSWTATRPSPVEKLKQTCHHRGLTTKLCTICSEKKGKVSVERDIYSRNKGKVSVHCDGVYSQNKGKVSIERDIYSGKKSKVSEERDKHAKKWINNTCHVVRPDHKEVTKFLRPADSRPRRDVNLCPIFQRDQKVNDVRTRTCNDTFSDLDDKYHAIPNRAQKYSSQNVLYRRPKINKAEQQERLKQAAIKLKWLTQMPLKAQFKERALGKINKDTLKKHVFKGLFRKGSETHICKTGGRSSCQHKLAAASSSSSPTSVRPPVARYKQKPWFDHHRIYRTCPDLRRQNKAKGITRKTNSSHKLKSSPESSDRRKKLPSPEFVKPDSVERGNREVTDLEDANLRNKVRGVFVRFRNRAPTMGSAEFGLCNETSVSREQTLSRDAAHSARRMSFRSLEDSIAGNSPVISDHRYRSYNMPPNSSRVQYHKSLALIRRPTKEKVAPNPPRKLFKTKVHGANERCSTRLFTDASMSDQIRRGKSVTSLSFGSPPRCRTNRTAMSREVEKLVLSSFAKALSGSTKQRKGKKRVLSSLTRAPSGSPKQRKGKKLVLSSQSSFTRAPSGSPKQRKGKKLVLSSQSSFTRATSGSPKQRKGKKLLHRNLHSTKKSPVEKKSKNQMMPQSPGRMCYMNKLARPKMLKGLTNYSLASISPNEKIVPSVSGEIISAQLMSYLSPLNCMLSRKEQMNNLRAQRSMSSKPAAHRLSDQTLLRMSQACSRKTTCVELPRHKCGSPRAGHNRVAVTSPSSRNGLKYKKKHIPSARSQAPVRFDVLQAIRNSPRVKACTKWGDKDNKMYRTKSKIATNCGVLKKCPKERFSPPLKSARNKPKARNTRTSSTSKNIGSQTCKNPATKCQRFLESHASPLDSKYRSKQTGQNECADLPSTNQKKVQLEFVNSQKQLSQRDATKRVQFGEHITRKQGFVSANRVGARNFKRISPRQPELFPIFWSVDKNRSRGDGRLKPRPFPQAETSESCFQDSHVEPDRFCTSPNYDLYSKEPEKIIYTNNNVADMKINYSTKPALPLALDSHATNLQLQNTHGGIDQNTRNGHTTFEFTRDQSFKHPTRGLSLARIRRGWNSLSRLPDTGQDNLTPLSLGQKSSLTDIASETTKMDDPTQICRSILSQQRGVTNNTSTENSSIFHNTTDDVSASAIFDNSSPGLECPTSTTQISKKVKYPGPQQHFMHQTTQQCQQIRRQHCQTSNVHHQINKQHRQFCSTNLKMIALTHRPLPETIHHKQLRELQRPQTRH